MMKTTNSCAWDAINEQLQAKEQEKTVVAVMTRMVKYIMSKSADDGLRWQGTKYDLLEMLKLVYDKGSIIQSDGSSAGFMYLAKRTFAILHETMVRNPYSKAQRASERKGIRSKCLLDRMKYVVACGEEGRIEAFCKTLIINAV